MCRLEPRDLTGELGQLRIGKPAVDWYGQEISQLQAEKAAQEDPAKALPWAVLQEQFFARGRRWSACSIPVARPIGEPGEIDGSEESSARSISPSASAAMPARTDARPKTSCPKGRKSSCLPPPSRP